MLDCTTVACSIVHHYSLRNLYMMTCFVLCTGEESSLLNHLFVMWSCQICTEICAEVFYHKCNFSRPTGFSECSPHGPHARVDFLGGLVPVTLVFKLKVLTCAMKQSLVFRETVRDFLLNDIGVIFGIEHNLHVAAQTVFDICNIYAYQHWLNTLFCTELDIVFTITSASLALSVVVRLCVKL